MTKVTQIYFNILYLLICLFSSIILSILISNEYKLYNSNQGKISYIDKINSEIKVSESVIIKLDDKNSKKQTEKTKNDTLNKKLKSVNESLNKYDKLNKQLETKIKNYTK